MCLNELGFVGGFLAVILEREKVKKKIIKEGEKNPIGFTNYLNTNTFNSPDFVLVKFAPSPPPF